LTRFEVDVLIIGGDLPAHAKCNKITAHNGYFTCTYCLFAGVSCTKHKHVLYPHKDYTETCPSPRTQQYLSHCVVQIESSKTKNFKICGVYGRSTLSPLISIPVQLILDYFHLTLEIQPSILTKSMENNFS